MRWDETRAGTASGRRIAGKIYLTEAGLGVAGVEVGQQFGGDEITNPAANGPGAHVCCLEAYRAQIRLLERAAVGEGQEVVIAEGADQPARADLIVAAGANGANPRFAAGADGRG